jgi:hypothetical protein
MAECIPPEELMLRREAKIPPFYISMEENLT